MIKCKFLLFCFIFIGVSNCKASDSLKYYKLKGVDVSIGAIGFNAGNKTYANLLNELTPDGVRSMYNYATSQVNDPITIPVKISLGIVFGTNQRSNTYFVNKHELLFKFSFETQQMHKRVINISRPAAPDPNYRSSASFGYTYQTQTIGLGYQLSAKSFCKNLALFGGVNADFGMVTYKRISSLNYDDYYTLNEIKNYNTTLLRLNSQIGLKYNFSCDINFFLQAEFGFLHYGKGISTNAVYSGGAFGIRYKFLEEQDKLNYKDVGFW